VDLFLENKCFLLFSRRLVGGKKFKTTGRSKKKKKISPPLGGVRGGFKREA